jgi:RNA polymerase sigma-70 factor (ECF subfamily)
LTSPGSKDPGLAEREELQLRKQADSRFPALTSVEITKSTDEQLVCRAGQGCAACFEELCRRYQVPLLDWFRFRGHGADGEDLLQETLVRVYRNLHRYDPRWRFSTWVFIIARRIAINHHQRFRIPADDQASKTAVARDSPPDERLTINDQRERLWDVARRALTDEEATALWLHYVEELPTQEIALILERSRTSVKTMMCRARKKLRPYLASFHRDE